MATMQFVAMYGQDVLHATTYDEMAAWATTEQIQDVKVSTPRYMDGTRDGQIVRIYSVDVQVGADPRDKRTISDTTRTLKQVVAEIVKEAKARKRLNAITRRVIAQTERF